MYDLSSRASPCGDFVLWLVYPSYAKWAKRIEIKVAKKIPMAIEKLAIGELKLKHAARNGAQPSRG
jgi:hypothetical protein